MTLAQQTIIDRLPLEIGTEEVYRHNYYTRRKRLLTPLAAAMFDFITQARGVGPMDHLGQYESGVEYRGHQVKMQDWHSARMLFHVLWPDEYMDLID